MKPKIIIFKPIVLYELSHYTIETWDLDNKHHIDVAMQLNDILMKCVEEHRKRPDRIGKVTYKKLEKALHLLDQANALLLDTYRINYKEAPFSELMPEGYKSLTNIMTFSEDKLLKSVQISNAKNWITLLVWINRNKPVSIPKSNKRREIIATELYTLYQKYTGKKYIRSNKPGHEGTRIHSRFSKVALLIDKLAGNPHYALDSIDIWKDGHLNIEEIVNCSERTISTFCQSLEEYIPK